MTMSSNRACDFKILTSYRLHNISTQMYLRTVYTQHASLANNVEVKLQCSIIIVTILHVYIQCS